MARTTNDAKLETRAARDRLPVGKKLHFKTLLPGKLHLAYRRRRKGEAGKWLARIYQGKERYRIVPLGLADDLDESNGSTILSFSEAQKAAFKSTKTEQPRGTLTVKAAMKDYFDYKRDTGTDISDPERKAKVHIIPQLGSLKVDDLTSEQLRKWLKKLADSPALKRSKKGGKQQFKPLPDADDEDGQRARRASANRVLSTLKAALNFAYDEKRVSSNEAWGRRLKPFKGVDAARLRFLTLAEAQRLLNACAPEFRPLVRGALETGARYSELCRLRVGDFNPDNGSVFVQKSKAGKARHVILTEDGISFFKDQVKGRAGNERMFQRESGTEWRGAQQGRFMKEANKRAKLSPPVSFHGLRHTWASLSVMAGVPLMVVAKNLGHADTRMVEKHYGHLAPGYVIDAIRAGAPKFGKVESNVRSLT